MTDRHASSMQTDPALCLALLWDAGSVPDLNLFLVGHPRMVPSDLSAVVRVDQSRRWQRGDRRRIEHYFDRFPAIKDDPIAALDLIHHEYILRERLGPPPSVGEFTARFPEHAATIRDQIAIHLALATGVARGDLPLVDRTGVSSPGLLTERSPLAPPYQFGRYALLEMLGRGAMGTVYRALDDQLDRQVALKVLRVGPDPDGQLTRRFLREAGIAANFTDPRLCPVHDAGVLEGFHYFTMPLIIGESARHPHETRRGRRSMRGRAAGRHDRSCRLDRPPRGRRAPRPETGERNDDTRRITGRPRLWPGGRGRPVRDAFATEHGVVLGTPAYMAPEQIGGDSRSVGPAADVYSLGVILYQLLTGRLPFDGPSHELFAAGATEDPVRPSQIRPELEATIETVCLTAMARDAPDRFRSMDAFALSLESYLDGTAKDTPRWRRRFVARIAGFFALGVICSRPWRSGFTLPRSARFRTGPRRNRLAHFPKGAIWTGRFVFRGRLSGYEGDAVVRVIDSRGEQFRANYSTEGGKFEWEVSGTERDDHVHWEFVREIKGHVNPSIVGHARFRALPRRRSRPHLHGWRLVGRSHPHGALPDAFAPGLPGNSRARSRPLPGEQ